MPRPLESSGILRHLGADTRARFCFRRFGLGLRMVGRSGRPSRSEGKSEEPMAGTGYRVPGSRFRVRGSGFLAPRSCPSSQPCLVSMPRRRRNGRQSRKRPPGRPWTPPAGDRPANPRFAPASASKRPPARLTGASFTGRSTVKRVLSASLPDLIPRRRYRQPWPARAARRGVGPAGPARPPARRTADGRLDTLRLARRDSAGAMENGAMAPAAPPACTAFRATLA